MTSATDVSEMFKYAQVSSAFKVNGWTFTVDAGTPGQKKPDVEQMFSYAISPCKLDISGWTLPSGVTLSNLEGKGGMIKYLLAYVITSSSGAFSSAGAESELSGGNGRFWKWFSGYRQSGQ